MKTPRSKHIKAITWTVSEVGEHGMPGMSAFYRTKADPNPWFDRAMAPPSTKIEVAKLDIQLRGFG